MIEGREFGGAQFGTDNYSRAELLDDETALDLINLIPSKKPYARMGMKDLSRDVPIPSGILAFERAFRGRIDGNDVTIVAFYTGIYSSQIVVTEDDGTSYTVDASFSGGNRYGPSITFVQIQETVMLVCVSTQLNSWHGRVIRKIAGAYVTIPSFHAGWNSSSGIYDRWAVDFDTTIEPTCSAGVRSDEFSWANGANTSDGQNAMFIGYSYAFVRRTDADAFTDPSHLGERAYSKSTTIWDPGDFESATILKDNVRIARIFKEPLNDPATPYHLLRTTCPSGKYALGAYDPAIGHKQLYKNVSLAAQVVNDANLADTALFEPISQTDIVGLNDAPNALIGLPAKNSGVAPNYDYASLPPELTHIRIFRTLPFTSYEEVQGAFFRFVIDIPLDANWSELKLGYHSVKYWFDNITESSLLGSDHGIRNIGGNPVPTGFSATYAAGRVWVASGTSKGKVFGSIIPDESRDVIKSAGIFNYLTDWFDINEDVKQLHLADYDLLAIGASNAFVLLSGSLDAPPKKMPVPCGTNCPRTVVSTHVGVIWLSKIGPVVYSNGSVSLLEGKWLDSVVWPKRTRSLFSDGPHSNSLTLDDLEQGVPEAVYCRGHYMVFHLLSSDVTAADAFCWKLPESDGSYGGWRLITGFGSRLKVMQSNADEAIALYEKNAGFLTSVQMMNHESFTDDSTPFVSQMTKFFRPYKDNVDKMAELRNIDIDIVRGLDEATQLLIPEINIWNDIDEQAGISSLTYDTSLAAPPARLARWRLIFLQGGYSTGFRLQITMPGIGTTDLTPGINSIKAYYWGRRRISPDSFVASFPVGEQ